MGQVVLLRSPGKFIPASSAPTARARRSGTPGGGSALADADPSGTSRR